VLPCTILMSLIGKHCVHRKKVYLSFFFF